MMDRPVRPMIDGSGYDTPKRTISCRVAVDHEPFRANHQEIVHPEMLMASLATPAIKAVGIRKVICLQTDFTDLKLRLEFIGSGSQLPLRSDRQYGMTGL
ncbi:hypothetical protein HPB50_009070 [Hyalomma asiaticum]|uniref:Uncharacterized protein n=1 Tax=Hyalomma asiaticum TaxID=266040 RepID=A0ACB7RL66_HYAAI|nr:hypothetical protein HPB50_009070 [Hyalomma asiaticum]